MGGTTAMNVKKTAAAARSGMRALRDRIALSYCINWLFAWDFERKMGAKGRCTTSRQC
jgi:hypothetical protein